ncbi:asparagine synthase (glutamine-hydrolyzing) [Larkinella sp. GY13]|uniref:asparagine synthase (glutamine-hydrolyzing) n=1 Tax=Larkinella sp. GY13 TaxID=3453720 RepID=UPI003EE891BF
MCGIFGTVNWPHDSPAYLRGSLLHRGPDEQRDWRQDNVYLFHARLAIQDLSPGGRQPMTYGIYTIIFNGEIYNHKHLRQRYNLSCQSSSDTETLLHLFVLLGLKMLDQLDGMFAFALYDTQAQTILLVRDRAGKKPLYVYQHNNQLAFSSELNALAAYLPLSVDDQALARYLRVGFLYGQQTPYCNVMELPAGHYAEIDCRTGTLAISSWWDITTFAQQVRPILETEALEQVDTCLRKAVNQRIDSSDLEVGVFLSGGIDSGLITAMAAQFKPGIRSFTVSFANGEYDEAPLARLVADRYQTKHKEVRLSFERLQDDIERIIAGYGEPFMDSSAIPSYYVAQAARKHLTVILNGDGADELFGGYRRYVPAARFDFNNFPSVVQRSADVLYRSLPYPTNKKSRYNFAFRMLDMARKSGLERYLSATTDVFENYTEAFYQPVPLADLAGALDRLRMSGLSSLQQMQVADFQTILPGNLLVKMDIATMAHSLEGRSPFLAKDLLELAPTLPDSLKIHGTTTKYLLRQLAKKYLPQKLIDQPKRGFEVPLKQWMDKQLKTVVCDYLAEPQLAQRYIRREFISKLINQPDKFPAEKRAKMLYSLFAMEVWYRKAVRND